MEEGDRKEYDMEIKEVNFTEEMIRQAKTCKSLEELIALAKEKGLELTEEEARGYFERINAANGELADDELGSVSGGGICDTYSDLYYITNNNGYCSACETTKLVKIRISNDYYWYCETCQKRTKTPVYDMA